MTCHCWNKELVMFMVLEVPAVGKGCDKHLVRTTAVPSHRVPWWGWWLRFASVWNPPDSHRSASQCLRRSELRGSSDELGKGPKGCRPPATATSAALQPGSPDMRHHSHECEPKGIDTLNWVLCFAALRARVCACVSLPFPVSACEPGQLLPWSMVRGWAECHSPPALCRSWCLSPIHIPAIVTIVTA